MSTRPTQLTLWATDDNFTNGPFPGLPTKVDPGALANEGAVPEDQLPAEYYNFLLHQYGDWINHLRGQVSALESVSNYMKGDGGPGQSNGELIFADVNGGFFVESGGFGSINISYNGDTEAAASSSMFQDEGSLTDYATDGSTVVVVGDNQTGNSTIGYSSDDGANWQDCTRATNYSDTVFACYDGTNFFISGLNQPVTPQRSADGITFVNAVNPGITGNPDLRDLTADPINGEICWLAEGGDIAFSSDSGATWFDPSYSGTPWEDFSANSVHYDELRDNWVLVGEETNNNNLAYLVIDRATRTITGRFNIDTWPDLGGPSFDNNVTDIIGGAVLTLATNGPGGLNQRLLVAFDADPAGNHNARIIKGIEPSSNNCVRNAGDRLVFTSSGNNLYYTQRWAP